MMRVLLLILALVSAPAAAEEVVLGLSRDEVAITTRFDGSEILIFGAIKREEPIPADSELDVIITLAGPSQPVTVRRKARRFGIWINTDAVEVDAAPSFYAVAASGVLPELLKDVEDLRHRISINRAIRSVGAPETVTDSESFTEALIRIRRENGLYQRLDDHVVVDQQTLFRTSVTMPANLTEGAYATRIFLVRDGMVVSEKSTKIDVRKVGLERWLFTLSRQQPLIYGLLSLAIAIAAGWGASAVFRYIRA
ncbi:MAG: TIGR02186 family protein [Proteobacteria bacterium]|nr:TIGR02186 family protein [Pseudomonadota bacterium]